LKIACDQDQRMLFRIENDDHEPTILVQSHRRPDWEIGFEGLHVLAQPVQYKEIDLSFHKEQRLRFRLCANPTIKQNGARLGLLREEGQTEWLERKMREAGAGLLGCQTRRCGFQHSRKSGIENEQVHWLVCFDGLVVVRNPESFAEAVSAGIGPAKGYGCGLLSLAPAG
jgi:CRISPR system Cascade subunit CasE